jgi:hypothetical protein
LVDKKKKREYNRYKKKEKARRSPNASHAEMQKGETRDTKRVWRLGLSDNRDS